MGLAGYREALLHHINRLSTCSLSRVPLQQLTRESPTALLPYAARGISSQSAPRFAQQASNEVRLLKNSILCSISCPRQSGKCMWFFLALLYLWCLYIFITQHPSSTDDWCENLLILFTILAEKRSLKAARRRPLWLNYWQDPRETCECCRGCILQLGHSGRISCCWGCCLCSF